jgi:hypothetical protein
MYVIKYMNRELTQPKNYYIYRIHMKRLNSYVCTHDLVLVLFVWGQKACSALISSFSWRLVGPNYIRSHHEWIPAHTISLLVTTERYLIPQLPIGI